MTGDCHVRFRERLGGRFPGSTRLPQIFRSERASTNEARDPWLKWKSPSEPIQSHPLATRRDWFYEVCSAGKEGIEHGSSLCTFMRACKQELFHAKSYRANIVLNRVIVDLKDSVFYVTLNFIPLRKRMLWKCCLSSSYSLARNMKLLQKRSRFSVAIAQSPYS